jgi:hypothetical protein
MLYAVLSYDINLIGNSFLFIVGWEFQTYVAVRKYKVYYIAIIWTLEIAACMRENMHGGWPVFVLMGFSLLFSVCFLFFF